MSLVQDDILRELSHKFNKDIRHIKTICYYPIRFTKEIIENTLDDRPIRIRYFGAFTQKYISDKDLIMSVRVKHLLNNLEDVAIMMATTMEFIIPKISSAKKIIEDIVKTKDYEKLNLIWEEWKLYKK
jgi:hypothetical protein